MAAMVCSVWYSCVYVCKIAADMCAHAANCCCHNLLCLSLLLSTNASLLQQQAQCLCAWHGTVLAHTTRPPTQGDPTGRPCGRCAFVHNTHMHTQYTNNTLLQYTVHTRQCCFLHVAHIQHTRVNKHHTLLHIQHTQVNKHHTQCQPNRFAPEANHGANAGLAVARELLEPIKKRFPFISYADLYTLAGVVAIEEVREGVGCFSSLLFLLHMLIVPCCTHTCVYRKPH